MRERKRVTHPVGGEKIVQQHFKDDTDINKIMERHLKTGAPPRGAGIPSNRQPRYTALNGKTYHEMLCQVQEVQGEFAGLPGKVRKRFANNPERLLEFLQDEKNLPEAVELGLIEEANLPPEKRPQTTMIQTVDPEQWRRFQEWQSNNNANPVEESEQKHSADSAGRSAKNAGRRTS